MHRKRPGVCGFLGQLRAKLRIQFEDGWDMNERGMHACMHEMHGDERSVGMGWGLVVSIWAWASCAWDDDENPVE